MRNRCSASGRKAISPVDSFGATVSFLGLLFCGALGMDSAILERAFFEARLKINRAARHIDEAQHHFSAYTQTDFCNVVEDTDTEPGQQIIRAVAAPIPADLVLSIGDAFHCMSAALDYVSSGLMRAKTGSATRITFPSDEFRNSLRKSFMAPKSGKKTPPNRRIMEAFPLIAFELLTVIQPYKGGNFGIWEIRKADNIDKHNLIIPSVTITELRGVSYVDEVRNNSVTGMTLRLGAGGTINAISYGGGSKLKLTQKGQATARITFPDTSEIFAGNPVFPTLIQSVQLVAQTIERIEIIARKYT